MLFANLPPSFEQAPSPLVLISLETVTGALEISVLIRVVTTGFTDATVARGRYVGIALGGTAAGMEATIVGGGAMLGAGTGEGVVMGTGVPTGVIIFAAGFCVTFCSCG